MFKTVYQIASIMSMDFNEKRTLHCNVLFLCSSGITSYPFRRQPASEEHLL